MAARVVVVVLLSCALAVVACDNEGATTNQAAAQAPAKPDRIEVPDVVGKTFGDAKRTLAHAGLRLRTQGFPGTLGSRGYDAKCTVVTSEAPPGGTRVRKGSDVAILYGVCRKEIISGDNGADG